MTSVRPSPQPAWFLMRTQSEPTCRAARKQGCSRWRRGLGVSCHETSQSNLKISFLNSSEKPGPYSPLPDRGSTCPAQPVLFSLCHGFHKKKNLTSQNKGRGKRKMTAKMIGFLWILPFLCSSLVKCSVWKDSTCRCKTKKKVTSEPNSTSI